MSNAALALLLVVTVLAMAVGATLGWTHRPQRHVLERVAWSIVGAVMAASFAFGVPAGCVDQARWGDQEDVGRPPAGRYPGV